MVFHSFIVFFNIGSMRVETVFGQHQMEHTMYRDNAIFHVLSTAITGGFYTKMERKTRKKKLPNIINQPVVVTAYNRYRGGVDQATKFLHSLRLFRRDMKWTMRVFRGLLGLTVLNIKLIWEQHVGRKIRSIREFVLELARELAINSG